MLKDCSLIISSFFMSFWMPFTKKKYTMGKTLNFDQKKNRKRRKQQTKSFLWLLDHLLLEKILKSVYEIFFSCLFLLLGLYAINHCLISKDTMVELRIIDNHSHHIKGCFSFLSHWLSNCCKHSFTTHSFTKLFSSSLH